MIEHLLPSAHTIGTFMTVGPPSKLHLEPVEQLPMQYGKVYSSFQQLFDEYVKLTVLANTVFCRSEHAAKNGTQ